MSGQENWVTVAISDNLKPGAVLGATIGESNIAVYNIDGTFYATDNICSHAFALLSEGFLDGDVIECPLHAGAFEVKTGKAVCEPAVFDIKTYPTRVAGGEVQIQID